MEISKSEYEKANEIIQRKNAEINELQIAEAKAKQFQAEEKARQEQLIKQNTEIQRQNLIKRFSKNPVNLYLKCWNCKEELAVSQEAFFKVMKNPVTIYLKTDCPKCQAINFSSIQFPKYEEQIRNPINDISKWLYAVHSNWFNKSESKEMRTF